jgi:hypothetical protein
MRQMGDGVKRSSKKWVTLQGKVGEPSRLTLRTPQAEGVSRDVLLLRANRAGLLVEEGKAGRLTYGG